MIRGMPKLDEYEAILITEAILAMKGLHQRKHTAAWEEGVLKLAKKPPSYQGNTHSWMRHTGQFECEKWTIMPPMEDDTIQFKEPVKHIRCPECKHE